MTRTDQIKFLNEDFRNGYNAGTDAPNPHLWSSRAWEAFELGRWMHQTGRPSTGVRPSRGATWNTDSGLTIAFWYKPGGGFKLERIA